MTQTNQSIWGYAKKDDASWYFKKILSIREYLDEAKLQQAARGDKFSTKNCYNSLMEETPFAYANAIWDTLVIPKHRFIFWQIANSHLLTRDYLHRIMVTPNNLCPVFVAVNRWLGDFHWPLSTVEMLQYCCNATRDLRKRILNAVMAAVFYFLWKNRNNKEFVRTTFHGGLEEEDNDK
ncbi:hypothetical protein F8388_005965 [Cannabis sativa]|uniref:Reverse transcriptase zinc-binding domain-containing protein n=1 Tax=Cannabis sativa TaxID=3483 RepID=A0A7J6DVI1_CANSA|nr:hypothetical protein F8388_005965 [Cannabis sativa]